MLYENGHIINIATHLITFLWTDLITNHFSTDFIKAEFLKKKKQQLHIKAIFWLPQYTRVHPSWPDNPIYLGTLRCTHTFPPFGLPVYPN